VKLALFSAQPPNRSLKPTKAGLGMLERPEGRGGGSFARYFPVHLLR